MNYSFTTNIIKKIRKRTPLSIRQKIGPAVAYLLYILRVYLGLGRMNVKILSISETLDLIDKKELSVIRYGDGEISLIDGEDLLFQKYSPELAKRLEGIFTSDQEGLLICATDIWGKLDDLEPYARTFNMHQAYRMGSVWKKLFIKGRTYGETNITRHYLAYKDKSKADYLFKKLFKLWEAKKVILIEGEKSRLGVGNDLFSNTLSLKRILCPPENAYSVYEKILDVAKKADKDTLILISLGPTAKVLAYDLFNLGYRVLDIGHIDMEYEMFLRKQKKQVRVPYKYFNEIHERNPEECNDPIYRKQILTHVQ